MSCIKHVDRRKLKLTPSLAYILGVLCGDGYISLSKIRKNRIVIGLNCNDIDFACDFANKIEEWIDYKVKIRKESQKREVIINGRGGVRQPFRFKVTFGTSDENFYNFFRNFQGNTYNWDVPKEIYDSDDETIILPFLKGFADSEGSVCTRQISFYSVSKLGLIQYSQLLRKIGINERFGSITISKNYLYINSRENLRLFLTKIGFSIKRKYNKLEKLISNYKRNYCYTPDDYENVKRMYKENITLLQISKKLKMPYRTILGWVYNQYKPLSIETVLPKVKS